MYTLEELSDLHLADLQARLYSEETIKGRRRVLGAFMRWARRIRYAREVTEKIIRRYLVYLRKRSLSERSIAETLTVLRVFFRYLLRTNHILSDPTWNVRLSGAHSPLPQVLSGLEVERVLARPDVETTEGLRDRTILELLYATGMRRTELVNLCVSDIDFSAGSIFIREGKGRKDRIVPAGERALFWLQRYLAIRPNLVKGKDTGNIFLNFYGKTMKKNDVSTLAGRYVRAVTGRGGACHLFRHSCATLMLENGADIRYIQELLGHVNCDTTRIYTQVNIKHLRESYRRHHPAYLPEENEIKGQLSGRDSVIYLPPQVQKKKEEKQQHPVIEEYIEYLLSEGYSESTIEDVRRRLGDLYSFGEKQKIAFPAGIRSSFLESYRRELAERRKKDGSLFPVLYQYRVLCQVRTFCRYLVRCGHVLVDPVLPLPRKPRKLPSDTLSAAEVELILSQVNTEQPYGIRDRAMLELVYATAIRRGELRALKVTDIHFEQKTLRVPEVKTKVRTVPLSERALFYLSRYLEAVRPLIVEKAGADSGHLFLSPTGGELYKRIPGKILMRYVQASGVQKHVSLHTFRHTVATLLLESGADIRAVQELLGHVRLNTTQIYTRVSIKKLREVHSATHPAALWLKKDRLRYGEMQERQA